MAFVTCAEAAKLLRVSKETVQKYCREGLLKARKVGRQYLIDRADLDRFLNR